MIARCISRDDVLAECLAIGGAVLTGIAIVSGSKIFLIPLLLLIILGWVRFAAGYPAAALIVVVFFSEACFDLVTFGIRQRFLSDIAIGLLCLPIIFNCRKVWNHIVSERSPYAFGILFFFIAVLNASYFGAHLVFGQPVVVGLVVARKYLLFLSYFFLVSVDADRNECFLLLKYLCWLGTGIAILSVIDAMLGGGAVFHYYQNIGQERAGMLRIHIGTFLIVYSIIYGIIALGYWATTVQEKLRYLGVICICVLTVLFVVMTRALLLGLVGVLILWGIRRINDKRIMLLSFVFSIGALLLLSGLGENIYAGSVVDKIVNLTVNEVNSKEGNVAIREQEAAYFLKLTWENAPVSGIGMMSNKHYPSNPLLVAREYNHFYISDINGLATSIYFGLFGTLLVIYFTGKSMKDSFLLFKITASNEKYYFALILLVFLYIVLTPTLNNIIVSRMIVYSGIFFFIINRALKDMKTIKLKEL